MRKELREQTRESHQRLDEIVGALDPFSNPQSYKLYLLSMYRLYERYADPLDRSSGLANLSLTSAELKACLVKDIGTVPEKFLVPRREWSLAQTWGAGYVLEGSAMGARYIVQQLDPDMPSSYLSRLANDSHQRWPKFIESLDEAGCDVNETVLAAKEVFDFAGDVFSQAARPDQPISGNAT